MQICQNHYTVHTIQYFTCGFNNSPICALNYVYHKINILFTRIKLKIQHACTVQCTILVNNILTKILLNKFCSYYTLKRVWKNLPKGTFLSKKVFILYRSILQSSNIFGAGKGCFPLIQKRILKKI